MGILTASKDILPAMKAVRESGRPAYVLVAPAFLGQFSEEVTPGKLRSAFNALGFAGMLEVALFADILTLKAVSYTHLDVYKRQAQEMGKEPCLVCEPPR